MNRKDMIHSQFKKLYQRVLYDFELLQNFHRFLIAFRV